MSSVMSVGIWELVSTFGGVGLVFLAAIWTVATVLLKRYDTGLASRFTAHEKAESEKYSTLNASIDSRFDSSEYARTEAQKTWRLTLDPISSHVSEEPKRWEIIATQLNDVRRDIEAKNQRLTRVEEALRHLPGNETIGSIHKRLDDLSSLVHNMSGQLDVLDPLQKSIDRVNDYLLNQK